MKRKTLDTQPVPKCCILILLDGLGDRSYPVLNNKTPLQAAHTPHLDLLAKSGANGMFHYDQYGMALPSENAHFAIFGYAEEFPGRGLLEALGAGMTVAPDEIPMLAHFVSLEEQEKTLVLAKDRPETSDEEAEIFTKAIESYESEGISFRYTQTKRLDGIVTMGGSASPAVTDSDCFVEGEPLIDVLPLRDAEDIDMAENTAKALKEYLVWSYKTLCRHPFNEKRKKSGAFPVNGLVTQRPGMMAKVESFACRWGLRAASISSGLMYWGLGRFLNMDVQEVKDSDNPGEDLVARLQWAISQRDNYEFIHVHTKTPDAAAHTKDPVNKVKAIESLDRGVGKVLEQLLDGETILVVTADHSTPSSGPLVHSGEPVPIMAVGPGIRVDTISSFDEVSCAGGALGQLRHSDFMHCVLNWLERAKLQGLMDSPEDHPYWPGKRRPFRLD